MIRLPIVDSDEYLIVDDRPGQWLQRHGFRIYRTRIGHCRPYFLFRVEHGKWPRNVPIARWVVGGYRTGMYTRSTSMATFWTAAGPTLRLSERAVRLPESRRL